MIAAKASYFARTALGGMWRDPFVHVIAIASLAIALVGFGLARIAGAQIDALVSALGGEVELTVYLKDGTPAEEVKKLEAALAQRTGGVARTVSPAEALGRLSEQLGPQGQALTELGANPLPWSVEVTLPPQLRDLASLQALAQTLRALTFVEAVDYGADALERLAALSKGLKLASVVAFAIVFLTTIVVVSATLQLAIYSRREEIEIQKLVGATNRFVRAPFLLEGMVQGLLSAVLATLALWALVTWAAPRAAGMLGFLALPKGSQLMSTRLMVELLLLGLAMGLSGSVVAVRRFLRV
ncbi:MAG: transporter, permease protein [Myxococcaceae bacterium]|nr:transporter, permease protein [Myxococcaceae bacterium]